MHRVTVVGVVGALVFMSSSCATFDTRTHERQELLQTRALEAERSALNRLEACSLADSTVSCTVTSVTTCTPLTERVYRRFSDTEREINGSLLVQDSRKEHTARSSTLVGEWIAGIAGGLSAVGGGALLALNPKVCTSDNPYPANGNAASQTCKGTSGTGGLLLGLGAALLVVPVVDSFRSIDTSQDLGRTTAIERGQSKECDRGPARGAKATVALFNGTTAQGQADDHGTIAFTLPPTFVPPSDLVPWATIRVEGVTEEFGFRPSKDQAAKVVERVRVAQAEQKAAKEREAVSAWITTTRDLLAKVDDALKRSDADEAVQYYEKIVDPPTESAETEGVVVRARQIEESVVKSCERSVGEAARKGDVETALAVFKALKQIVANGYAPDRYQGNVGKAKLSLTKLRLPPADAMNMALDEAFPLGEGGTVALDAKNATLYALITKGDAIDLINTLDPAAAAEYSKLSGYKRDAYAEQFRTRHRDVISAEQKLMGEMPFAWAFKANVRYRNRTFYLLLQDAGPSPMLFRRNTCMAFTQGQLFTEQLSSFTVGAWPRVQCELQGDDDAALDTCYVELAGLPEPIKTRMDSDLNKTIAARWTWRGLPNQLGKKCTMGSRRPTVFDRDYLLPTKLALELVDENGAVLWRLE